MLQIIDIENNELFNEISNEESVSVSGCEVAPYAFAAPHSPPDFLLG